MNREPISTHALGEVPGAHRDDVRAALLTALPHDPAISLSTVTGGASGAIVQRVEHDGPPLLLRVETARDLFRNPHRSYPCMRAAADAGIAPRLHVADADAGIVIMDFVDVQPLESHPGGPHAVMRELGDLVARLQATPVSPPLLDDFASVLDGMLGYVEGAGLFEAGVLAPVRQEFERIKAEYPWSSDPQVSSHNDVNPYNVLYDGTRLWLIDWEIAFCNDRFADIACVANNFIDTFVTFGVAPAEELEGALLSAWLGRAAGASDVARLRQMRQLNRLFYGCLMLTSTMRDRETETEFVALTADEFRIAIETGRLGLGSPDLLHEMGKMQFAGFLAGAE
jgi:aminoglycoside phosphotransferase (APT) family kinase protein